MIKFMVVLYRRRDLSAEEFAAKLRTVHGPMAERIPGLKRYVQNHVTIGRSRASIATTICARNPMSPKTP